MSMSMNDPGLDHSFGSHTRMVPSRLQETASPEMELRRKRKLRHGIQDPNLVGGAIVVGVKHETDVFGNRAVDVDAGVVQQELVAIGPSRNSRMNETGLQACANGNRPQLNLRS